MASPVISAMVRSFGHAMPPPFEKLISASRTRAEQSNPEQRKTRSSMGTIANLLLSLREGIKYVTPFICASSQWIGKCHS
jgi:hypothetical protein